MSKKSSTTRNRIALFFLGLWFLVFSSFPGAQAETISDDAGREVEIPSPCERIVSLSPATTEIVFSLSLGEKLVGVTTYCNYPEEAKKKEKVRTINEISLEKWWSCSPIWF